MREQGRETRLEPAPGAGSSPDPVPPEVPPTAPVSQNPANRVEGLRARLLAGEYEVPAMLVAERMIALALGLTDTRPPAKRDLPQRPGARPPSEAA